MKKYLKNILAFSMALTIFVGCSPAESEASPSTPTTNETVTEDSSTNETVTEDSLTYTLDELGLTYTLPENWLDYGSNIMPLYYENDYGIAEVIYSYIPNEYVEGVINGTVNPELVAVSIFQILFANTVEFEESGNKEKVESFYNEFQVVEQTDKYSYYFYTNFKSATSRLSEEDLVTYNAIVELSKEVPETIETFEFDDTAILNRIAFFENNISFSTKTLTGEAIDSSIFANYDITAISFGGEFTFPEFNQMDTLQDFYFISSKINSAKVNFISIFSDGADSEKAKTIMAEYKEVNGDFPILVPDSYLAKWINQNLVGIPSMIFVDSQGKVIGETITGAKDLDLYLAELEARIELLNSGEY